MSMERYTERQQDVLARIDPRMRDYQQLVYDAALDIWREIKSDWEEHLPDAQLFMLDLAELANQRLGNKLSKPEEEYDLIAEQVIEILDQQGHSFHSRHCTIVELARIIKDETGQSAAPLGLINGAIITI